MTLGMRQLAPWPEVLVTLVEKLRYKKGWSFRLADLDRGQGSTGLTLVIRLDTVDSYAPETEFSVVPPAAYNLASWRRWLFGQILLVERHEAAEFFVIEGARPYAPHHGPGFDPYQIFEHGEQADAQTTFRGERFTLEDAP